MPKVTNICLIPIFDGPKPSRWERLWLWGRRMSRGVMTLGIVIAAWRGDWGGLLLIASALLVMWKVEG